jgi:hypothetical protein
MKILIVILTLATVVFLGFFSCERHTSSDSLRIVQINNNQPLEVDVADWTLITDPEDPTETIPAFYVKDWIVPVEFSYVEQGIGLPTASSYTARITNYKVSFSKVLTNPQDVPWVLSSVTGVTNILVPTDPEGQRTTIGYLKVIPASWIYAHFEDSIQNRSPGIVRGAVLKATLVVNGYEELTKETITDTATFTIDIGDYYDDPTRIGK